jgi:hypothetical protein
MSRPYGWDERKNGRKAPFSPLRPGTCGGKDAPFGDNLQDFGNPANADVSCLAGQRKCKSAITKAIRPAAITVITVASIQRLDRTLCAP